jgi:ABC-type Fe3+/spermidine/putrescine transport system ATPase subunit
VRANIAYGLRARRVPAQEAAARVAECLALLRLEPFAERYPAALSGGQRQRVAVARALAPRPDLLLLDEPFSALDRHLREATQLELSLLLRRLGITTILVTHDQREAFALADRIALMEGGRIVQVGTPREVYTRPASEFVHGFLGTGSRLPARLAAGRVEAPSGIGFALPAGAAPPAGPLALLLRSEEIRLAAAPTAVHAGPPGRVVLTTFLGGVERCVVELAGAQVVADLPPGETRWHADDAAFLDFVPARALLVPEGTAADA